MSRRAILLVCLFFPGLLLAEGEMPGSSSFYMSGLLAGNIQYQQTSAGTGSNFRTFSVPIILPMEANLGRFNIGGHVQYDVKEFASGNQTQHIEGPGYVGATGRFQALRGDRYRLEFIEGIDVPVSRAETDNLPLQSQAFLTAGYRVDSGLAFSYLFDRAQLQFGVGHRLNLAKNAYNPGDEMSASIRFGYGLGSQTDFQRRFPVSLFLGITSRYRYADQYQKELVQGTEYGTVFVAPGFQFQTNAVILHATVEVPVYHMRPTPDSFQDRMRGNIGMKYMLR